MKTSMNREVSIRQRMVSKRVFAKRGLRVGAPWIVAVAQAFVIACANTSVPVEGADGESHFLTACDQDCSGDLACVDQVCTQACEGERDCTALSPTAACIGANERHCDVECESAADCEATGSNLTCTDGRCRVKAMPQPGEEGTACFTGSECASGVCEGMGCGPDVPGTCAPGSRNCTQDPVAYCGCDDVTFYGSGSCPGERYARRGECECRGMGRYQAGKEGSYLPCCGGLTEVFWRVGGEQDGQRVCADPPGHREYACVEGTCGDGRCEPGEDGACGCAADCPGAVWEGSVTDGNPGTPTQNPHAIDPAGEVAGNHCDPAFDDGRSCEAAFAAVSACADASEATLLTGGLDVITGEGCYYFCPDVPDCEALSLEDASALLCRFAGGNGISESLGLRTLCGPTPTAFGPCCFGIDAVTLFD